MSSEQLAACPSGHTRTTRDNNNIYGVWWVKCADGDCSWRTAGDTEAEAITVWNTRITAPTRDGEVGRLREALEPFARYAEQYDRGGQPQRRPVADDYRRARAALATQAEK